MKKVIAAFAVAAAAALIAGCGTDGTPTKVDPVAAHNTEQSSSDPDAPTPKQVGERAYWSCPLAAKTKDEWERDCSLVFTVTDVVDVDPSECSSYAIEGKEGLRIIRVSIDADSRKPMLGVTPRSSAAGVLTTQFWSGESPDGYVTRAEATYGCGEHNSSDYGPFQETLGVGRKARGVMDFAVPSNSTKLLLAYFESPGWVWELSPVS